MRATGVNRMWGRPPVCQLAGPPARAVVGKGAEPEAPCTGRPEVCPTPEEMQMGCLGGFGFIECMEGFG